MWTSLLLITLSFVQANQGVSDKLRLEKQNKAARAASNKAREAPANCALNQFVYHRQYGFGIVQSASTLMQGAFSVSEGERAGSERCFVYYFHPPRHAAADRQDLVDVQLPKCQAYGDCVQSGQGRERMHLETRLCVDDVYQGERIYGIRNAPGAEHSYQILTSRAGSSAGLEQQVGGGVKAPKAVDPIAGVGREEELRRQRVAVMNSNERRQELLQEVFNLQTVNLREVWEQESLRLRSGRSVSANTVVSGYSQNSEYDRSGGQNASCPQTDQEADLETLRRLERPRSSKAKE